MESEDKHQQQEIEVCKIEMQRFIEMSNSISVRCVGSLKTIFKHQKYILQVHILNQLVIRCFKRYNDFEALYQLIKMKYKNKEMEEFPSKFQVFGREETRKQYFQKFLTSLIKEHDSNRRLLSIVFLFLTKNIKSLEGIKQDNEGLTLSALQKAKTEASKSFMSQKRLSQHSELEKHNKMLQETVLDQIPKKEDTSKRCVMNMTVDKKKKAINQFEVKFQSEEEWRIRYIKVEGSQLIFYKHKLVSDQNTAISHKCRIFEENNELFRAFLLKNGAPYSTSHLIKQISSGKIVPIQSLFHEYDCEKILIRKVHSQGEQVHKEILEKLREQIQLASKLSPKQQNFQGVFHPIGKLFIVLKKLKLEWKDINQDQIIIIRIVTSSFSYQSKEMVYRNELSIKQGFLIPICSAYESISVECLIVKDLGWIREGRQQTVIGVYKISMVDLLTSPRGNFTKEVQMAQELHQEGENTKSLKNKKQTTLLSLTVENFSHFSSIYSDSFANQNDGKVVHSLKADDVTELSITVNRVLRVLGYIALFIQAFWRNIYLFKYPRLGYIFWSCLFINLLTTDANRTLYHVVVGLSCIILYNNKVIKVYADEFLNYYIFVLHPNFKKPQILSKSQVTFLKFSNQLKYIGQQYKIQQQQLGAYKVAKKSQKSRTLWQFERHQRIFQIREQQQSFLQKIMEIKKVVQLVYKIINTIVNTVQKITSLLTWVDIKKTLFVLFLLFLLSGLASSLLLRGIFMILSIHRLVKGKQFYKSKHYYNNKHFAVYSMRYVINKSFPQLVPKHLNLMTNNFEQLSEALAEVIFPIHDFDLAQKLKVEMQEIVSVYLDVEGLAVEYGKKETKNTLKIGRILQMVETCESRLKLKWIPGKEGISNEFQELKSLTKQIPVIDVWVQSLLINFVLNTPSKLYCTLFPRNHDQ